MEHFLPICVKISNYANTASKRCLLIIKQVSRWAWAQSPSRDTERNIIAYEINRRGHPLCFQTRHHLDEQFIYTNLIPSWIQSLKRNRNRKLSFQSTKWFQSDLITRDYQSRDTKFPALTHTVTYEESNDNVRCACRGLCEPNIARESANDMNKRVSGGDVKFRLEAFSFPSFRSSPAEIKFLSTVEAEMPRGCEASTYKQALNTFFIGVWLTAGRSDAVRSRWENISRWTIG
jgi:hypothetical protein